MGIQQDIINSVLEEETDYIAYVTLETGKLHTIVSSGSSDTLPKEGDYDSVIAACILKRLHPEDSEMCEKQLALVQLQKQLEQSTRCEILYRILCGKDYHRKQLHVTYQNDEKNILVMVCRDVTKNYEDGQRMREEIYCAMMEAKKANQEKSEFLERMSHEIRTPMNSIIGLTYLSKEKVDNQKQLLENLEKIEKSACFLRGIIDDILNLSLLESGRVAKNDDNIEFGVFLEMLAVWTRTKAEDKQISFSMQTRGNFAEEYRFDGEKLREALSNILHNAIKYTQPNGHVTFIAELLQDMKQTAWLRFEVQDTGIGMDAAFLPHVFEAFEQEKESNTTLYGGMGLGLTIAKNIIDFMNGKIDVYSERGKGSTFVVTVPLQKVEQETKGTHKHGKIADTEYDFTGKRVLLVEDNEINIEITRNILVHKNFIVEVAVNGKEGMECFQSHEEGYYDVILMDIRMPVMDGLTAAGKIRNSISPDGSNVPIIAMTANAFEEDVRKSLDAGMDAHLNKPVDIRKMYALLDSIIFG